MSTAEQAFWLAAERYENSPHTIEDVWAAWDLVTDFTDDVEVRIQTRDLLNRQYYGFRNVIDARELYTDPDVPADRTNIHPDWFITDREDFHREIYGQSAHARYS
jgi:hypothetical protein